MSENNAPMKAASVMYMLVAIVVLWDGVNNVNFITKTFELAPYTYHISIIILVGFLLLFFLYMVYNGLIAESLIAIVVMMTLGSYSIACMLNVEGVTTIFNPMMVLIGLIPIIVIGLERKRIPIAIACVLVLAGFYLVLDDTNMQLIIRATLMAIAGVIFGCYSGYLMYNVLNGNNFERTHRALNATAVCETIGYLMLASSMLYSIVLTNENFVEYRNLHLVILTMSAAIAMIIAVYSAVNGSISSGTMILVISSILILTGFTGEKDEIYISSIVCIMLMIPLLFTAYRFHRKRDDLLTIISLISIVCIGLKCALQYHDDSTLNFITSVVMLIDSGLMFYAAFARTLYIETGEKKVPLFDGGSFVNQEEPWNRRFQPKSDDKDNSIAIQTYLMISIGLLLLGCYLLNVQYGFWYVDTSLFHLSLAIVSATIILFSMENLIKGRLTETVGAIFIGVFLLSFALSGIYDVEHMTKQDFVPALCILACGIMFFFHKEYVMCAAFIVTSVSIMCSIMDDGNKYLVFVSVLLLIAGTLLMLKYQIRKMITKKRNPTITDSGGATDNVNLARLARTLGVLILGLVLVMMSFADNMSSKFAIMMIMLAGISSFVSIYGLMKDDAPGFMFIFGTSIMIVIIATCLLVTDYINTELIATVFMWVLIPLILVYLKRGKRISAMIATVMLFALILDIFTEWNALINALFLLTGILLCILALINWLVHEGILGQDMKDRASKLLG